MISITVWKDEDGMDRFAVHRIEGANGDKAVDITAEYHVHEMAVEDEDGGVFVGWHIGKRAPDFGGA